MNPNHQWSSDWDSLIHRVFNVGRRDPGKPAANMVLESSWQVFKSQQTIFKLCDPTCLYPSDPWIPRVESRYYPESLAGLPWGFVITYVQYLAQDPRTTTREVSQGRKGHEKQKRIKGWRGDHCPRSYCRAKNCTDTLPSRAWLGWRNQLPGSILFIGFVIQTQEVTMQCGHSAKGCVRMTHHRSNWCCE